MPRGALRCYDNPRKEPVLFACGNHACLGFLGRSISQPGYRFFRHRPPGNPSAFRSLLLHTSDFFIHSLEPSRDSISNLFPDDHSVALCLNSASSFRNRSLESLQSSGCQAVEASDEAILSHLPSIAACDYCSHYDLFWALPGHDGEKASPTLPPQVLVNEGRLFCYSLRTDFNESTLT